LFLNIGFLVELIITFINVQYSLVFSEVGKSGVPGGLITLRSVETDGEAVAEFKSTPRYFLLHFIYYSLNRD